MTLAFTYSYTTNLLISSSAIIYDIKFIERDYILLTCYDYYYYMYQFDFKVGYVIDDIFVDSYFT
jgi:hypothetical protein